MKIVHQGSILQIPAFNQKVLVLSRDYFNRTGMLIVCPVRKTAGEAALNIPVFSGNDTGYAILDQMRGIDIRARHYSLLGEISMEQMQNISDAAQDIFDYYPLIDS